MSDDDKIGRDKGLIHPEVTKVDLGQWTHYYVATEKERLAFEAAVRGHAAFMLEVGESSGFSDGRLDLRHSDAQSFVEFRGARHGRTFVFSVSRDVHPAHGLAVERVAGPIADLIVKMRSASNLNDVHGSPPLKLYWLGDPEGADDWFVTARSARDAKRFYRCYFGDDSETQSRYQCEAVATLPPAFQKVDDEVFNIHDERGAGWPSHEAVQACGGVFQREDQPRVVVLGGRTFTEGMLDAVVERARRREGPDPQ